MRAIYALVILALAGSASAQQASEPDDAAALQLADRPAEAPQAGKSWRAYAEAAASRGWFASPTPASDGLRASFDFRFDGRLSPGLRAVLSDRLDLTRHTQVSPREHNVNALREAYLSWQPQPDLSLDAGRVNVRHGSAWGYNPTDYFRGGALRSIVSPDPASLRENRLGTVVLQGQKLWADGALSGTFSPKLASTPNRDDTWSADLGSTNARNRWLFTASHRIAPGFSPQLLLHGGQGMSTQVGVNASGLLNNATVVFAEASFGRGPRLVDEALGLPADDAWRRRAAAGLTVTTAFNLSVTGELDFNSAAPDRAQWDALRGSSPAAALALLQAAQQLQELPMRRGAFFYATWHDAMLLRLDLSAFLRTELETHSRAQWLEARYHWDKVDFALQWLVYSGARDALYTWVPQRRTVEASLRLYF